MTTIRLIAVNNAKLVLSGTAPLAITNILTLIPIQNFARVQSATTRTTEIVVVCNRLHAMVERQPLGHAKIFLRWTGWKTSESTTAPRIFAGIQMLIFAAERSTR
jgi:hypothetical protein